MMGGVATPYRFLFGYASHVTHECVRSTRQVQIQVFGLFFLGVVNATISSVLLGFGVEMRSGSFRFFQSG